MIIICQTDIMLRDLSGMSMEILLSGENHNVWNLVFPLCMSECLVKVQDTAMSLLHSSPSTLLALATIAGRLVIPLLHAAFRGSVP
jgi:hypothetical protein